MHHEWQILAFSATPAGSKPLALGHSTFQQCCIVVLCNELAISLRDGPSSFVFQKHRVCCLPFHTTRGQVQKVHLDRFAILNPAAFGDWLTKPQLPPTRLVRHMHMRLIMYMCVNKVPCNHYIVL